MEVWQRSLTLAANPNLTLSLALTLTLTLALTPSNHQSSSRPDPVKKKIYGL